MTGNACWWWWFVLGSLLGWMANGWLGYKTRLAMGRGGEISVDRHAHDGAQQVVEPSLEQIHDKPVPVNRTQVLEAQGVQGRPEGQEGQEVQAVQPTVVQSSPPLSIDAVTAPTAVPDAHETVSAADPQLAPERPVGKIMDRALERLIERQAAERLRAGVDKGAAK